jgi:hypothetical protein
MPDDDTFADADFSGRGFEGQQLAGADFTGADLRGADFTGADLRSASFCDARLGVRPAIGVAILGLALIVSAGAGVAIGWAMTGTRSRLAADEWDQVAEGGALVFLLVILVGIIVWKGFDLAIRVVVVAYVAVFVVSFLANFFFEEVEWMRTLRGTLLLVVFVLAILAGILGRVIGGVFGSWSVSVVALLGGLASGRAEGGVAGIVVAVSLVIISKRALRGDTRDRTIRRVAHRLVRRWGTSFVDANLTGADFTGADASRSDLRGAIVDSVRWDPEQTPMVDVPDFDPTTNR